METKGNATNASTKQTVEDFYTIGQPLGSGRFGKVFVVKNKDSGKEFAGKRCRLHRVAQRKDIEHEVAIMRKLDHPMLLKVFDEFFERREATLILELVTGGELFDRIADDSFDMTEKLAASYVRQICEGIEHMHSVGILHLDIKPENILCLRPELLERIKIIDFGFARYYSSSTPLKVMFGTPEFVAPEVVNYDPLGEGTDVWSIGVITYMLLSGLSPFLGDSDNETLANVTAGGVDFDEECFDDVTDDAKNFILSLLDKDVKNRPSCEECLNIPWLKKSHKFSTYKSLCVAVFNMKKYVIRRKWKRTINAVKAMNRLQAGVKRCEN